MKRYYLYGGLLFLATSGLLSAQQATKSPPALPPIPPGPLMQTRAPDPSQWVTRLTEKKSNSTDLPVTDSASKETGKETLLTVVTTTKTGALKQRQLVDTSGATWETWCSGNLQITLRPNSTGPLIFRGKSKADDISSPFNIDYSQSDFPDITIVSMPNYAGIETAYGVKCLVFKAMTSLAQDAPAVEAKVYVNLETRLPVALVGGDRVLTYQFLSPPSTLTLPPEVKNLIQMDAKIDRSGTGWRPH